MSHENDFHNAENDNAHSSAYAFETAINEASNREHEYTPGELRKRTRKILSFVNLISPIIVRRGTW